MRRRRFGGTEDGTKILKLPLSPYVHFTGGTRNSLNAFYMTGGTVIPKMPRQRTNSRRMTETVSSRNCFR